MGAGIVTAGCVASAIVALLPWRRPPAPPGPHQRRVRPRAPALRATRTGSSYRYDSLVAPPLSARIHRQHRGATGLQPGTRELTRSCRSPSTSKSHVPWLHLPTTGIAGQAGRTFLAFLPAISAAALKRISGVVRHWRLQRRFFHTWEELAAAINPILAGWMLVPRPVLPVGAVSPPGAHQRLLGALAPQQVPTTRGRSGSSAQVRRPRPGHSDAVHALEMGPHRLVTSMTRAR